MYNLKDGILDYEDVLTKLKQIELKSNGLIKKKVDSPKTSNGYEIPHYIVGQGPKHIIILGGVHANEIISVDFVLKFMESIANGETDIDFNDVTLDIIPLDNPEGYIIATSAVRTIIDKDMADNEIEKIATAYYQAYREDNIEVAKEKKENTPINKRSVKKHHQMFKDANYECIPDKHKIIKEKVKGMMQKESFPEGSMIDFKCNADGIEIATKACEILAKNLAIKANDVIVASTGVIGQPLSIKPFEEGIPEIIKGLGNTEEHATKACQGIMTTDTKVKQIALEFEVGGKVAKLGAMTKGSGMISPAMATMPKFRNV